MRTFVWGFKLLVISVMTGCGGCGDICPPDEKVGELDLHSEVLNMIPYDGSERLIFKNMSGDSLVLFSDKGREVSRDRLCVKDICTEPEIKGETSCEYFESESHRFIFRNDDQNALMDFLVYGELIRPETELFRQSFRLSWNFQENLFATGERVIKIIPENIQVDPSEFNIQVMFEPIGEIIINGETYQDVWKADDTIMNLYFNTTQGLVAFETPDEFWNLKSR